MQMMMLHKQRPITVEDQKQLKSVALACLLCA